jgi:hypothetical protein
MKDKTITYCDGVPNKRRDFDHTPASLYAM